MADVIVKTPDGAIRGLTTATQDQFFGVPYAKQPIGDLRWKPPQPYGKWTGVLDATVGIHSCVQSDGAGGTFGIEDCLFVNIFRSNQKNQDGQHGSRNEGDHHNDGLPVMVWIHGGGLVSGGANFYDPTPLLQHGDVIVVAVNYRIGLLGFFAHPAIDAEGHLNGNYGLMDQQAALKWIRRNIHAFGGDPHRVTIFGESAGGTSVLANLASPTAAGLFQRAIEESGASASFAGHFPFTDYLTSIVPLVNAEPGGTAFAASVGCADQSVACLRGLAPETIVLAQPSGLEPIVDGTVLTQTPGAAIGSGAFNRVPVITGSNHDEWRYFVALQYDFGGGPLTNADYPAAVAAFLGAGVNDPFTQFILGVYPLSNYPPPPPFLVSAPLGLGALGTDLVFACPARNAAQVLSQYVTSYAYEFNDENAPSIFPPASFPLGAYHFSEVPYLFAFGVSTLFTPDQQKLSNTMISYWTEFAANGDPNSEEEPHWPRYSAATDRILSLVPPTPTVETTFDSEHKCSSLWNTF
jgi:para-nitrobenzyl esterase